MSFDRTAARRAWPSYWLFPARRLAWPRPWAVVLAVAAFAAIALLAQPILTATWTSEAVRFIARSAALQERAAGFRGAARTDLAVRRWLDESRALLTDLPLALDLPEPAAAGAFDDVDGAKPLLEKATASVAESLQRHLRVDIAVRMALLLVAVGGGWIGFRLRRQDAGPAREAAEDALAAAPPDRWLALVDRVMAELATATPGEAALANVARALQATLEAGACGICLADDVHESMQVPAVIHTGALGWGELEQLRRLPVAGRCRDFELPRADPHEAEGPAAGVAVPVGDDKTRYGHLFALRPQWPEQAASRLQVMELVARHLALAIGHCRRNQESRRIALIEERTSMARELHDSLAQSLSFMKIQVSRVQALLQRGRGEEVAAAAEDLREGLNGAYRKLRELLTTFRTHISAGGLAAALEEALEEYGARSSVAMTLDNRLGGCQLGANEEFHLVQIVREALSNVVRHAGASQAVVKLAVLDDGWVEATIEDDGEGFEAAADARAHHGTTIMRERALGLGGALSIGPRPQGGGCCVTVRFKPAAAAGE